TVPPLPDLCRVRVEDRLDVKALTPEILVAVQRLADLPRTHQRHAPRTDQPQDRAQFLDQLGYRVPQSPLPERTELRQVLPHLRRRRPRPTRELLARDRRHTAIEAFYEHAQVDRKPANRRFRHLL